MSTVSTGTAVSMGDVYALLLEDIRRNRAARGADLGAAVTYIIGLADGDEPERGDDEAQRVGLVDAGGTP